MERFIIFFQEQEKIQSSIKDCHDALQQIVDQSLQKIIDLDATETNFEEIDALIKKTKEQIETFLSKSPREEDFAKQHQELNQLENQIRILFYFKETILYLQTIIQDISFINKQLQKSENANSQVSSEQWKAEWTRYLNNSEHILHNTTQEMERKYDTYQYNLNNQNTSDNLIDSNFIEINGEIQNILTEIQEIVGRTKLNSDFITTFREIFQKQSAEKNNLDNFVDSAAYNDFNTQYLSLCQQKDGLKDKIWAQVQANSSILEKNSG